MKAILFAALLTTLGVTVGCEKREDQKSDAERAGEKIDQQAEDLKEKVDD